MGTGIAAAIPLTFELAEWVMSAKERYFSKGFFDCYELIESQGKEIFEIKKGLLISNYKSFLVEFYALIEEDFHEETKLAIDSIPDADSIKRFAKVFDGERRNNRAPYVDGGAMFSSTGCNCIEFWMFYSGSHKAYIEVYSTLWHFERILAKAMSNPLANAVKFGIYG